MTATAGLGGAGLLALLSSLGADIPIDPAILDRGIEVLLFMTMIFLRSARIPPAPLTQEGAEAKIERLRQAVAAAEGAMEEVRSGGSSFAGAPVESRNVVERAKEGDLDALEEIVSNARAFLAKERQQRGEKQDV